MPPHSLKIDLTYARSPLFVRQTLAHAFGIPLGQEFTWTILRDLICGLPESALPAEITFVGFVQMSLIIPDEAENLRAFMRELKKYHPAITTWITILD